jgi:hypothetical protein
MKFDSIDGIKRCGFEGFLAISALQASRCHEVPDERGVYLVLRSKKARPVFLSQSTGGHFKGKDPTVAVNQLEKSWVENSLVLYIGKAGGPGKTATLRSRICLYMRFGQRESVAHWGGRYIWQIKQSGSLIVCWRPMPNGDPRLVEKGLIQDFKDTHDGRRPFANLRG